MEERGSVIFKATNNSLIFIMREEDSFEEIYGLIEKKLTTAGKFFKGASLSVKYRGRKLTLEEENKISRLMSEKMEAKIITFGEDIGYDKTISEDTIDFKGNNETELSMNKWYFKGIEEGVTKFYKGTVRSGQLLKFNGNIVILGDVNPGAEIEATGNVIIIGTLRGTVHAGMDGNKEAIIVALGLQPIQIRIAEVITRPPDDVIERISMIPEIAYIKDNMIYIDRFLAQR